ncbi:hypothetical protein AL486_13750 [Pandoraea apista]|uniref:hypothetical protein n=1 Tax=Pandoraea apista TaxID=93218 RepID=UPI000CE99E92|nr:hypothetical protein [Pandoraea apista]AVF40659.1 hypothetical protein AL486_13750 [Pandoraea apista]
MLEMSDAHRYFFTLRDPCFDSTDALEARVAGELSRCLRTYDLVRTTPVSSVDSQNGLHR